MQKNGEYMNLQSIFMKINIFKIIGTSTHRILKLIKPLYSPDKYINTLSLFYIPVLNIKQISLTL